MRAVIQAVRNSPWNVAVYESGTQVSAAMRDMVYDQVYATVHQPSGVSLAIRMGMEGYWPEDGEDG